MCNATLRHIRLAILAECITYSECVSAAVVTQHAKRMHRIILSPVACLAAPYFSTLSHKWQDFRGKNTQYKSVF
jgi:hypothetical protein